MDNASLGQRRTACSTRSRNASGGCSCLICSSVVVVDNEDFRHEPRAHGVALAERAVHDHSHAVLLLSVVSQFENWVNLKSRLSRLTLGLSRKRGPVFRWTREPPHKVPEKK